MERHAQACGFAQNRLAQAQNAAGAALRSVFPGITLHDGTVDTEEDGEDVWLVLREPSKNLPLAPVEAGDGGDGEAGVRPVGVEMSGETPFDRAVRREKP